MRTVVIAAALIIGVSTSALGNSRAKIEEIKSAVLLSAAHNSTRCNATLTKDGIEVVRHYQRNHAAGFAEATEGLIKYIEHTLDAAGVEFTVESSARLICRLAKKNFNNFHWAEMIQFTTAQTKKGQPN